jgi:S1-C subfamily serine protease
MSELFTLLVLVSVGLAPVPAEPPQDPLGWGYLGVAADPRSLRISTVQPGTPADKAGLQVGDELLYVGKERAEDWQEITEQICRTRPGTLIRIKVRRNGEEKTIAVRLGSRPPPPELPVPEFRRRPPVTPDR